MVTQRSWVSFVFALILLAIISPLLLTQTARSSNEAQETLDHQNTPAYCDGSTSDTTTSIDHNFAVYNDPSWSGSWCYSDTPMSANIASSCNNQTSSLFLASGWSVKLYNGQDQSGASVCFNRSDGNLNNNTYNDNSAMDDTISSFILYNQPWCGGNPSPTYPLEVYNDLNYTGSWCYSHEAMTANIASSCNDRVTSILLRSGWSIRVYRDVNQSGPSRCLNSSDPDLRNNTFEDGSTMNDAVSSFTLFSHTDCEGTPPPTLTRSRLYVDERNYLVLEFCGKNIDQNVYIGSKREGRDFGIHAKYVSFGSSEECAIDNDLADGEVLPGRTYYAGVALSQSDVYNICCSSNGLCDSVTTSPAQPVPPPQPPPGGPCSVPFYWQSDPRWKNHPLRTGGYGTCSSRCRTIGSCGCTLTSATMIFDYYGANTTRYGITMNPPNLSDCMGKYACPFTWGTGNWCANNKVSRRRVNFSWSLLEQELAHERPVILYLTRPKGSHYVVAVSGNGNSAQGYLVNDPALKQGARVRLSAVLARRNYTPRGMHLYSGTPDCQAAGVNGTSAPYHTTFSLSPTQPITGSIVPYRNTELTMTLELAAQSLDDDVTEMLIWTESISNTIWQPYTEYVALPLSEQYFVQFRDGVDNVSDVITTYSDPLASPPELQNVFLPLLLRQN